MSRASRASLELTPMTHTYTRTNRSYELAADQRHLSVDQPFNHLIPQNMYIVFVDSSAFGGSYAIKRSLIST